MPLAPLPAWIVRLALDGTRHALLDLVREVIPPFAPTQTVADFAKELRRYRCTEVTGDRYGSEWVAEAFRKEGIRYTPAEHPKSDLYKELLPAINSGVLELLDHPKILAQLCGLERRTARGGRDSIDHAPGGRDDVANSVAGAVQLALSRGRISFDDLYGDGGYYDTRVQPVAPDSDRPLRTGLIGDGDPGELPLSDFLGDDRLLLVDQWIKWKLRP